MTTDRYPSTLDDILAPRSADDFFRETWHRKFELIPGPEDKFGTLFGWDDVNHLLKHGRTAKPFIRLAHNGATVPENAYTTELTQGVRDRVPYRIVVPHKLAGLLRTGATLIINQVSAVSPRVHELARNLERTLGAAVNMNLYAGWRTDNGFGKHWDEHDFFILQVAGRKRWEVYPDTRPHPLSGDTAAQLAPTRPLWTGMLTRGDVLYVPRGWWHIAYPLDEPSLHLTTGIKTCSGDTVLTWLRTRLMASRHFRDDVPLVAGADAVREYLRKLRDEIAEQLGAGAAHEFGDWWDAKAMRTMDIDLPGSAASGEPPPAPAKLQLSVARRLRIDDLPHIDMIQIRVLESTLRFPRGVRNMLEALVDGRRATADELAALCNDTVPEAQRRQILRDLYRKGVVCAAPPQD